jgi:copper chaperone CopZ
MICLSIPDMMCSGCVSSITRAVQAIDPEARVAADLAAHTVEIQSGQPSEDLVAAIAGAGFTVAASA